MERVKLSKGTQTEADENSAPLNPILPSQHMSMHSLMVSQEGDELDDLFFQGVDFDVAPAGLELTRLGRKQIKEMNVEGESNEVMKSAQSFTFRHTLARSVKTMNRAPQTVITAEMAGTKRYAFKNIDLFTAIQSTDQKNGG